MNSKESDWIRSPQNDSRAPSKKTVGQYELGPLLGEGAWGKVKLGVHKKTKQKVAIKIIDKEKVRKENMGLQIKREVNIMKQIKHKNPHVVTLHEVLASKTKIYLVLELVTGGELFDKLVQEDRFSEDKARYFFRQLVVSVEICHNLGICHRDLKPENLLLDDDNKLKISDFGLSALYTSRPSQDDESDVFSSMSSRVELLHTTCGTPNYVSPEVLRDDGYDGRKADIWSMGVILYVLVTGTLPFDEQSLPKLFEKIHRADFYVPAYLSSSVADLIHKILDPNPAKRTTIAGIKSHAWFCDDEVKSKNTQKNMDGRRPSKELSITAKADFKHVMATMLKALRDLSFAAVASGETKIKGYKTTRRGMIGLIVDVSRRKDNSISINLRKGRGDIMEYNDELKKLKVKIHEIL